MNDAEIDLLCEKVRTQHAEIERLRALITAWADDHAHPVVDGYVRCTCQDRQCATGTALRKAVGR